MKYVHPVLTLVAGILVFLMKDQAITIVGAYLVIVGLWMLAMPSK